MGLLPDTQNCGLRMRRECWEHFLRHRGLAIRHASRHVRDACRDSKLAVSFEVGGGENVPGIHGASATRNFTYLARGPCGTVFSMIPHALYYSLVAEVRSIWSSIPDGLLIATNQCRWHNRH